MLLENCKVGLPVRIISKSVGQPLRDLGNDRVGKVQMIIKSNGDYNVDWYITVKTKRHTLNFLPKDVMPLWEDDV
jgi:hypothetical protein